MMTEDFGAFFDTGGFAQVVSVAGVDVTAIFDGPYTRSQAGVGLATTSPTLRLRTSDVPTSVIGQTATVDGTDYVVVENQPDGTGASILVLEVA